jgi:tetratricopeptide (TPR) repeat protein
MGKGPLDHPRLLAIERKLDAGEVDEAQHMLAQLGDIAFFRDATTYLATRVLFQRGRLTSEAVAERLRDLLGHVDYFPEAAAMLSAATAGNLASDKSFKPASLRARSKLPGTGHPGGSVPSVEVGVGLLTMEPTISDAPEDDDETDVEGALIIDEAEVLREPDIPRAGRVPRFSPPPDPTPSYAPEKALPEIPSLGPLEPPPAPELDDDRDTFDDEPPTLEDDDDRDTLDDGRDTLETANRYSETPISEVIAVRPGSRPPRKFGDEPPTLPDDRPVKRRGPAPMGKPTVREMRIRSGVPPAAGSGTPASLFEIAALADEGKLDDALLALEHARVELGADGALLRARLLDRAGRRPDALMVLARLAKAPLLDPEVRAGAARLLIELGRAELGLEQARVAVKDEGESPIIRLTAAWAALRVARRRDAAELSTEAEVWTANIKPRGVPLPGLLAAVRACLQAEGDAPERAVISAGRALHADPKSLDALAALALASARLGRSHDARQAWLRLRALDPDEAALVGPRVETHGVSLEGAEQTQFGHSLPADQTLWEPLELTVADGHFEEAATALEQMAKEAARHVTKRGGGELTIFGTIAASFLTTAPVFRDFAPWDFSLWSVARLDAALALLYGDGRSRTSPSDDRPLFLLLGSYLGESLRQPYGLGWQGSLAEPEAASLKHGSSELHPFRMVEGRMQRGLSLPADRALDFEHAHPGAEPWSHRTAVPIEPPYPWERTWPDRTAIPFIGRAVSRSPIAAWCERYAEGPLDRSLASIAAIDSYLALIAPPRAPRAEEPAWAVRAAVSIGSYLGETLRATSGGEWTSDDDASGAKAYVLLAGDAELRPVLRVWLRLQNQVGPLADFAQRAARH